MTNLEKYNKAFKRILKKEGEELKDLRYRGIPAWDSMGHMNLMGELKNFLTSCWIHKMFLHLQLMKRGKKFWQNTE